MWGALRKGIVSTLVFSACLSIFKVNQAMLLTVPALVLAVELLLWRLTDVRWPADNKHIGENKKTVMTK